MERVVQSVDVVGRARVHYFSSIPLIASVSSLSACVSMIGCPLCLCACCMLALLCVGGCYVVPCFYSIASFSEMSLSESLSVFREPLSKVVQFSILSSVLFLCACISVSSSSLKIILTCDVGIVHLSPLLNTTTNIYRFCCTSMKECVATSSMERRSIHVRVLLQGRSNIGNRGSPRFDRRNSW